MDLNRDKKHCYYKNHFPNEEKFQLYQKKKHIKKEQAFTLNFKYK